MNFVFSRKPVACGVTSLGMDHIITLGGTLESIAWQKAGIFKVLTDDPISRMILFNFSCSDSVHSAAVIHLTGF